MRGQLSSLPRAVRRKFTPDAAALSAEIARLHDVDPDRVFLTHGATEGNSLSLAFLARAVRHESGRAPVIGMRIPEYPSIGDTAQVVGFRAPTGRRPPDVLAFSRPNNPTGLSTDLEEIQSRAGKAGRLLVDEVFREFSGAASLTRRPALRTLWVVGSLTKAYGADDHRVGFVIPASADRVGFSRFHGLLLDQLPAASVSAGRAILAARPEILREAREVFHRNLAELRRRVPQVPALSAPLWFDRGNRSLSGDRLSRAAAKKGVLVCPGSFFGDPTGVRVSLTRRTFPADLQAYLEVRERFLAAGARGR
jgi:histidinol-phosphate/aromatic aminotransferase/cobyric acid decarboxylase-like protein